MYACVCLQTYVYVSVVGVCVSVCECMCACVGKDMAIWVEINGYYALWEQSAMHLDF